MAATSGRDSTGLTERILNEGYRLLLQFETPSSFTHKYISGYPWDPGWLHVFVKGSNHEEYEFAFIVQQ